MTLKNVNSTLVEKERTISYLKGRLEKRVTFKSFLEDHEADLPQLGKGVMEMAEGREEISCA